MESGGEVWGPSVDVEVMDFRVGDVVRLAASVTRAEFGLALCDDDGEMVEIDGKVLEIGPAFVKVLIRRTMVHSRLEGPVDSAVTRFVRRNEVLGLIDGEEHLWPRAARLKDVSAKRDGKPSRPPAPVYWTPGVDAIPVD